MKRNLDISSGEEIGTGKLFVDNENPQKKKRKCFKKAEKKIEAFLL